MPPRKSTTQSPHGQSFLNFRTPGKITKSQTPHSGIKKDIISTTPRKRAATSPPPDDPIPTVSSKQEVSQSEPAAETEEERLAASISHDSISAYYKDHILASRATRPLHREEFSLQENVLRHFDLSSQYGPCIGISRLSRWKRAQGLGMEPPVEVLALCLQVEGEVGGTLEKEREGKNGVDLKRDTRRSYLDDFLSTRTARVE